MIDTGYAASPIVIVGCQRSGTTLLRTILGHHPQLLEHPHEPQFILELYQRFGYQVKDVGTAVAYLCKHPYLPNTVTTAALQSLFAGKENLSLQEFFQIYLHLWAGELINHKRPILKDPALIFHLDLVVRLFPQATIIHVVRDPRATVSSQKTRWAQYTTWETAALWKKAVQHQAYWASKRKSPILELNYEKMLLNPVEALTALCQQLDIPFVPEMLSFEEVTTDYTPHALPKLVKFSSVDNSRLNLWQERLSPLDIRLIEYACHTEMSWWQYELINPTVPNRLFYRQLWAERLHTIYKVNGRRVKNLMRQIGWRLGIGLLKVPPKSLPNP